MSRPKKKTPVHVLETLASQKIEDLTADVEERYERVSRLLSDQDAATREAIEMMAETVSTVFPRRMWVAKTRTGERMVVDIPPEIHNKISVLVAVESVKDLALMDIKVANFKFNGDCAECGKPVKSKKGKRK